MENTENKNEHTEMWQHWEKSHRRGKVFGGILFVLAGSLFFAREMGAEIPAWVFTWKALLIGLGLLSGVKSGFRNTMWLILILIGSAFIISDSYPQLMINHLIWPSALILVGLFIIFKPRRKWNKHYWKGRYRNHNHFDKHQDYCNYQDDDSSEDALNVTSVMSGTKKTTVSKNFKGGEITVVLSGAQIDLSQADFTGTISLEVTAVLGGVQLIIPAHWEIESRLTSVMGGVHDKRPIKTATGMEVRKTLILKGSVFMGGIEISCY
ncbi:MAG: hypothetical protein ABI199_07030 [Bacteroidia bacterium]